MNGSVRGGVNRYVCDGARVSQDDGRNHVSV